MLAYFYFEVSHSMIYRRSTDFDHVRVVSHAALINLDQLVVNLSQNHDPKPEFILQQR